MSPEQDSQVSICIHKLPREPRGILRLRGRVPMFAGERCEMELFTCRCGVRKMQFFWGNSGSLGHFGSIAKNSSSFLSKRASVCCRLSVKLAWFWVVSEEDIELGSVDTLNESFPGYYFPWLYQCLSPKPSLRLALEPC